MANGYYIKGTDPESVGAAWEKIVDEFMSRYHEFLADAVNGTTMEFGKKYGFNLNADVLTKYSKDTQKNLLFFQSHVFSGRYIPAWEKVGYHSNTIWALFHEGLLSHEYYSSWKAHQTGMTDFYYISQKTAKEIHKEWKTKGE